jgi:hypothetical protein
MSIYNRIRPHGHILKMTEERVLKKLVSRELKERCPRGHQDQSGENRLVKLSQETEKMIVICSEKQNTNLWKGTAVWRAFSTAHTSATARSASVQMPASNRARALSPFSPSSLIKSHSSR